MMKIKNKISLSLFVLLLTLSSGCSSIAVTYTDPSAAVETISEQETSRVSAQPVSSAVTSGELTVTISGQSISLPAYSGQPYVAVNNNVPLFTEADMTTEAFESYSNLDSLERCGTAYACVGTETMPTEDRGDIGSIKPSGWQSVQYDNVDGGYLYNRCHLIGFQLTAENANAQNLITGTRYLNIEGMLPFENMVADYIKETGNHVMYRVTPVFEGNSLVASGVVMEAKSVEDDGDGILYCVYAYNVQPGINIDYATGASSLEENTQSATEGSTSQEAETGTDYILNTNSMKFHLPSCSSATDISDSNRQEYHGTRDELIGQGYEPCGRCNP